MRLRNAYFHNEGHDLNSQSLWLIYKAIFLHDFCIFSEKLEVLVEDEIVVWRMVINA